MSVFYFFPLYISSFKLSDLQSQIYSEATNTIIIGSIVVWGILPLFFLLLKKSTYQYKGILTVIGDKQSMIIRMISMGYIFLHLIENFILSGNFIPFLADISTALEIHTVSLPGIGFITKSTSAFAALSFLNYISKRRKTDILITFACMLLPITKFSRIELFTSIVCIFCIGFSLKFFSLKVKKIALYVLILTGLGMGGSYLGNLRGSQMGTYDISFAKLIQYNSDPGPFELYAVLYGYFCLPFEDLDRFVRHNKDNRLNGLISLMPVTNGLLNLDNLLDTPDMEIVDKYRADSTFGTSVSTSLSYFYLDLGEFWGLFPMLIYMCFLLYLYQNRFKNKQLLILYSIYLAAFSLTSFQAVMIGSLTIRTMIVSLVPFFIVRLKPELKPRF